MDAKNSAEEPDEVRKEMNVLTNSENREGETLPKPLPRLYVKDRNLDELFDIRSASRVEGLYYEGFALERIERRIRDNDEVARERWDRRLDELKNLLTKSNSMIEELDSKVIELRNVVATRDDIIEQKDQILQALQEKIEILRFMQENNIPHKRLARYSATILTFFIFSFLLNVFFDITIVVPLWNNMGLLISFGFLVMALAMGIDWREQLKKR